VEVIPDPSAILARRSTTRDALDAHKEKVVGGAFVREAIGATEDDAPTAEELAIFAAAETRAPLVEENPGPPVAAAMTLTIPDGRNEGMIEGAVAMAIDQARAKVGAKLRSKLRGNPDGEKLETVPNQLVAATCWDHAEDIDLDDTIRDALAGFMSWWEGRGFALTPREARLAVACYVKETLRQLKADPTPELLQSLVA
ncbi:MAG: hypothetical protein IMZ54_04785, partial [Acidobacteria bacterium]|nr:hypothetical protein [Acidobacteriota bacterium]